MAKEDQELNVMRGQSSSWFFIEELSIGMVSVNVTLSLTSSLDLSGGQVGVGMCAAAAAAVAVCVTAPWWLPNKIRGVFAPQWV